MRNRSPHRSVVTNIAIGLTSVIAAMMLSGCTSAAGSAGTPTVQPRWTSCAADAPTPTLAGHADAWSLPRLGTGFVPSAVVVCAAEEEQTGNGGDDLVAALRLPDERPTAGICTQEQRVVDWFALLDAHGRWIRAGTPQDECRKPRAEVSAAIYGMRLTRLSPSVLRVYTPPQTSATGCGQHSADMLSVGTKQSGAIHSYPFPAGARLSLCVYLVPVGEQGSATPAGDLESGGIVATERRPLIEKSLGSAPAAAECSTPAGRFAVLTRADGAGLPIYVGLDGCRRIMVGEDGTLAQADLTLMAQLGH